MSVAALAATLQPPAPSVELYRSVVDYAADAPSWLRHLAEVGTDAGLVLFAVLFLFGWWRARHAPAYALAVALVAPFATAALYVVSELAKSALHEDRPCRAVGGVADLVVATCPAVEDWSLPSNHSTIAAAAATTAVLAAAALTRRRALLLVSLGAGLLAVLMAFSRVFVGVHYPHDVAAGLLLGGVMAPPLCHLLASWATFGVRRLRAAGVLPFFLGTPAADQLPPTVPAGPAPSPSPLNSARTSSERSNASVDS